MNKNKMRQRWITICVIVLCWELIYRLKIFPEQLFPSAIQIFNALIHDLVDGKLLLQVGQSLLLIFLGLFLGFFIALALSFLGYFSSWSAYLLDTLIAILDPLPGVAILPLVILWIGIGESAVLCIMLHSIIWPILISIQTGIQSIDEIYIEIGKNNGIKPFQLFVYVLLPMSLPGILSGLRIGWSRSWRALISSEMIFGAIGSVGGIGWYLFEKRTFMNTPGMFAGLIVIIAISIFIEEIAFHKLEVHIKEVMQ